MVNTNTADKRLADTALVERTTGECMVDEPTVISSYLAMLERGREEEVVAELERLEGVEVHGVEYGHYVMSIEARTIDETYSKATAITRMDGVTTLNFVYCNFEDETLGLGKRR